MVDKINGDSLLAWGSERKFGEGDPHTQQDSASSTVPCGTETETDPLPSQLLACHFGGSRVSSTHALE